MLFYLDKAKWQKPTGMCLFGKHSPSQARLVNLLVHYVLLLQFVIFVRSLINSKLALSLNEGKHVVCWFKD